MRTTTFILSVCCFLLVFRSLGQDTLDYYKDLASNDDPELRRMALDSVLSKSRRTDPDTYALYGLEYVDFALKMDSVELAARKAIRIHYTLNSIKNQPKTALDMINSILERKDEIRDTYLLGKLYQQRGGSYFKLDVSKSIPDYDRSLEFFTASDSIHIADSNLFKGQAYSNMGKFVPAGESYQKAYEIYEALDDHQYMLYTRQGITTMFSMNGFLEKAMSERQENIQLIKNLDLTHHLPTEYYNQSLDYRKAGNLAKYREYLFLAEDAIRFARDKNMDISNESYIYAELLDLYCKEGQMERAAAYLKRLEKLYREGSDDLVITLHYYGGETRYNLTAGNNPRALEFAREKLRVAKQLNIEETILDAQMLAAEACRANGLYAEGLEHSMQYAALKDSVYNQGVANSLAYYQTLYETEHKEKELVEQTASIQLLERDNQTFKRLLLFGGLGVIMTFGIVLLYRNQMHLKKNKTMQEKFSQELLLSQENERRRISKDLHDGLGQQLLLLKNKLLVSGESDNSRLVDQTIEEVRSISRDLHPFQLQELGLTKALQHTITQIDENTTLFISADIDNIDNLFDKEGEVNIYRIVQESLSNILKHAQAEAGKVLIKRLKGKVVISIKDNGRGFNIQEEYKNVKSLGLKTLLERTKFLNGNMKISSKRNQGTTMEFQFPIS